MISKGLFFKFGIVMDFLINKELLICTQSACESSNAYLITKKEVKMKEKKERSKKELEEKSQRCRITKLDHLKLKLQLKQNDCSRSIVEKSITKSCPSQNNVQTAHSLVIIGLEQENFKFANLEKISHFVLDNIYV